MTNLNIKSKSKGFTIVELLVVIVVIGILTAISVVSYTGVSNKAKASKAQANADNVLTVANAYLAEKGSYPAAATNINDGQYAKVSSGVTVSATAPTAANGDTTVGYTICSTTGAKVTYWDYSLATPAIATVTSGTGC